jgi:ElaB/YqjD/DUF883 family membrane-anchored ribosome-binding protein
MTTPSSAVWNPPAPRSTAASTKSPTRRAARWSAHQGVDKLAGTASGVADRFADQTRRISEAPAQALEVSKSWVQEKPLEAVGAALAIGFILGRLTAR